MNHLDRRDFLGLTLAAGAATALPAWARTSHRGIRPMADTYFDVVPVGDKDNAFAIIGEGGNSLLINDGDSSLLIDTKFGPFGDVLFDDTKKLGAGDNLTVLNTHHHGDHTGGNHAFRDKAEIFAHPNAFPRIEGNMDWFRGMSDDAVQQLKDMPADKRELAEASVMKYAERIGQLESKAFEPTSQIIEPQEFIACGSIELELYYMGDGHTDNDLIVLCRELNFVHTGDFVFNGWNAFMDANGGCDPRNWRNILRNIRQFGNDTTTFIPGHGPLGSRSMLDVQIKYIEDIFESVGESVRDGITREQVTETTYGFQQGLDADWIRPIANGFIYDLLQE